MKMGKSIDSRIFTQLPGEKCNLYLQPQAMDKVFIWL